MVGPAVVTEAVEDDVPADDDVKILPSIDLCTLLLPEDAGGLRCKVEYE